MQFLNLIGWNLQSLSSETINPNVCYFAQMMYMRSSSRIPNSYQIQRKTWPSCALFSDWLMYVSEVLYIFSSFILVPVTDIAMIDNSIYFNNKVWSKILFILARTVFELTISHFIMAYHFTISDLDMGMRSLIQNRIKKIPGQGTLTQHISSRTWMLQNTFLTSMMAWMHIVVPTDKDHHIYHSCR